LAVDIACKWGMLFRQLTGSRYSSVAVIRSRSWLISSISGKRLFHYCQVLDAAEGLGPGQTDDMEARESSCCTRSCARRGGLHVAPCSMSTCRGVLLRFNLYRRLGLERGIAGKEGKEIKKRVRGGSQRNTRILDHEHQGLRVLVGYLLWTQVFLIFFLGPTCEAMYA
jgi:hypothetical protein